MERSQEQEPPKRELLIEATEEAIARARTQYFGTHWDGFYDESSPDDWPYYRVIVHSELERAVVEALRPACAHIETMLHSEYEDLVQTAVAA